jgi:hypothetical protein
MAVLQTDSKCSNTIVYAPLLNRFAPCFVEHLNHLIKSDVKSRIHAGGMICYFKDLFRFHIQNKVYN